MERNRLYLSNSVSLSNIVVLVVILISVPAATVDGTTISGKSDATAPTMVMSKRRLRMTKNDMLSPVVLCYLSRVVAYAK